MNCSRLHLRAACRLAFFCAETVFFYLLWLTFTPLVLNSKRISYWWRNFNFRGWAKVTAALLKIRLIVKGTPPRAPFLIVSNHLSYIDIIAFASQVDVVFVAKSDVAAWPALGLLCRSMGTIFVNRRSRKDVVRVNALIGQALAEGKGVLIFPEGTSTAGDEVLPFHSALLEPAVTGGYPVSFATVSYQTAPGQPSAQSSICWWGAMTFLPHLYRLLQLPSFEATLVFGSHSIRADDRKVLAKKLWQGVNDEFAYLDQKSLLHVDESATELPVEVQT